MSYLFVFVILPLFVLGICVTFANDGTEPVDPEDWRD